MIARIVWGVVGFALLAYAVLTMLGQWQMFPERPPLPVWRG